MFTTKLSRRDFIKTFGSMAGCFIVSATAPFIYKPLFAAGQAGGRFRFPQGVASGDPTKDSIILWTRVESDSDDQPINLRAQLSLTKDFAKVLADREVTVTEKSDHTLRLWINKLRPGTTYYYRFIAGSDISRTGRTFTAPRDNDTSPTRFAFVSCQHLQLGYMTPYRRMLAEDKKRRNEEQIQFVLHLGDFIYEEVWYPEETLDGTFLRRKLRDTVRFPDSGLIDDLRYPISLADYRHLYKAYLSDPDLQDARARWPFICVWDDHEFSNNSWQSQEMYDGDGVPAQSRKVAANQAWFEYIPALLSNNPGSPGVPSAARDFTPAKVENAAFDKFDEHYRSVEPNNLAAINSLIIYRSLRWGKNIELILTDNRSFRSPPVPNAELENKVRSRAALWFYPEDIITTLDAGREANLGKPPAAFSIGDESFANPNRARPPGTILGLDQKRWWMETARRSTATWKLWGNSFGALPRRADLHKLPDDLRALWKGESFGIYGNDDWVAYPWERNELLAYLAAEKIDNLVSLSGDRHNFTAGNLVTENNKPVAV
ncbi:MAG: alkaline phosphatase D family protein [Gammaproteobacteria bacterium]|nr:alkaline phosphatase D family protein [Gammaproteobacteria bacterium]